MDYANLPTSEPTITTDDYSKLRNAIANTLEKFGHTRAWYSMPAMGGPSSCRIFLIKKHPEAIELLDGYTSSAEITEELLLFGREQARYPYLESDGNTHKKGWEIRPFDQDGYQGVIATAMWT